jgi:predicted permease
MSGDFRYALRTLLKSPRFTVMAVLVLGVGIGANSAMFTVVDSVLIRPLPYHDPARVAVILGSTGDGAASRLPVTPGDYLDFRSQSRSFDDIAAANVWGPTLTGTDRAVRIDGLRASANLFQVLGVKAAYGRLFSAEDGAADAPEIAVLSYGLFEQRFGGDPRVVGQTITLDGKAHTIVGVTPRGFYFPPFWASNAAIYAASAYRAEENGGRGPGYLRLFGRLKSGVSYPQAQAEITTITRRLALEYPRTNAGLTATVTPIHEMSVGSVRPVLLVLFGAVACTLLIACANIVNLLIARASSRRKEIAIRQSLGAARTHIARQFVAETMLLALAGGTLGLLLAWWVVPVFVASIPEAGMFRLPRHNEIEMNGMVIAFNFAAAILAAVLCGVATAFQASRVDLNADLKESGRGQVAARSGRRLRSWVAGAQVAIALLLLAGAGLLVESYRKLQAVDPGFDPRGVAAVEVRLAASSHADPDRRAQFYAEALEQFRGLPGVVSASAVNHVPLAGDRFGTDLTLGGRPVPRPGETPNAVYRVAMPGYFSTMRMRLLRGRDFTEHDNERAAGVVVVNESAAKRFWPGEDPIGKRLHRGDAQSQEPWLTVVGVVADVKQTSWTEAADSEIYLPYLQDADYRHNPASFLAMTLVVRAANAGALAPAIRERIAAIDRNISVPNVFVMDQVVRDVRWQPRTSMTLVVFFAGVAALLAALGIYAVVSFLVAGRTQEIAVRMALGARRMDVLAMVLRQAMRPIAAGLGAGLAAALALTRLMSSMLYEVRPTDPLVFTAVAAGLTLVGLSASLIPARRAATLDPLAALRNE